MTTLADLDKACADLTVVSFGGPYRYRINTVAPCDSPSCYRHSTCVAAVDIRRVDRPDLELPAAHVSAGDLVVAVAHWAP